MFNLDVLAVVLAFVVGITVHEFAHGWTADRLGDPTARYAGRLTLNPVAHADPVGTILLPILLIATGSRFIFGWAKPVPINPYHFRDRRRGLVLVSVAGPLANVVTAVLAAVLLGFSGFTSPVLADIFITIIWINIILAVFNLIPVPPLDGSKILAGLLPGRQEWLIRFEQYGMIILVLLVFSGALGVLFRYIVDPAAKLLIFLATGVRF
ncbi:MAG: site-2 protease family protein [Ammonifex sp.]|nr:MAG: site-2 protease family protein [Ammonifex sp.]